MSSKESEGAELCLQRNRKKQNYVFKGIGRSRLMSSKESEGAELCLQRNRKEQVYVFKGIGRS